MSSVSVTSKGQVTVPKHIRDQLGINAGSQVEFELVNGNARMHLVRKGSKSRIVRDPLTTGDLFVPKTVVLELEWVLRGVAGQPRAKVLACLTHLSGLPGITLEDRKQVESALEASERGIDFADALHHAASATCEELLTFDARGHARRATRLKMKPSVKVPGN